jgi:GTP cyclohydrolase IA
VTRAVVSIGSNVDPDSNVPAAIARLRGAQFVDVLAVSPTYRTPAVGPPGQPEFHNAAVLVATDLDPAGLRHELRAVEGALGRVRTGDRFAPRTIDLDIVLFEGFEGSVDGSIIPDPDLERYPHLAVPAADVAPEWECGRGRRMLKEVAAGFSREDIHPVMLMDTNGQARYATEQRMEALPDEEFRPEFEGLVTQMLEMLGEDPEREGLRRTPLRVAKAMDFLTAGYGRTVDEVVNDALFESEAEEMVVVKDVEFYSLCEHHMLPFFGRAHVAYMPNKSIIGLSKIARIIDVFGRRLQVQERLTNQIADAIEQVLDPHGVAVVLEGNHFCMMMRGVQKQGSSMVTSAMRGGFKNNPSSRAEFMSLIRE